MQTRYATPSRVLSLLVLLLGFVLLPGTALAQNVQNCIQTEYNGPCLTGGETPAATSKAITPRAPQAFGDVIGSFASPTAGIPVGLEDNGNGDLYQTDIRTHVNATITTGGGLISSFSYQPNTKNGIGVTTDGTFIYITDFGDADVDIYTLAGAYVSSFAVASSFPEGITYNIDTGNLYIVDGSRFGNRVIEYTTAGALVTTYRIGGISQDGIAFDPNRCNYWIYDSGTDTVRHYNSSFVEVESFPGTRSNGFSLGEGVGVIGNELYVTVTRSGTVVIFDIADGQSECPNLGLNKIVDDPEPDYGQTVVFTVTLTNNEPSDVNGLEVTDNLPAGLDYVSSSTSQGSYDPGTGVWTIGTLSSGATATLSLYAAVNTLDETTNSASLTAGSRGTASATVTPQAADLAIDKVVDNDSPALGDEVTFTITVSHNDGADVVNVRAEDVLPAGLDYVSSATSQGSYNSATGIWEVGAMTEGQSETLTITAEVTSTDAITNTAFIASANKPDPFPGDNSDAAALNAEAADLEVTKAVTGFANDGGTITATYQIEVSNEGPSDTGGVEVTDYLSADMTVASISVSQGATGLGGGVVTWAVGALDDGDSATMTITVTVPDRGSLLNTAEVTDSDLPDPDSEPGDGEGDDHAAAAAGPRVVPDFVPGSGPGGIIDRGDRFAADLALTKDVALSGSTATYTLMVENLGPQSTAKVEATDVLPGCLTFTSASAGKGSYNETTGVWSIGTLKVDEKVALEIVTEVGADCSGTVTNTAEITSSSLPDPSDFFNLFDDPALANNRDDASFDVSSREVILDGTTFALGTNYPNPFNPETVIPFSLAQSAHVSIKVYDLLGRSVATLVNAELSAGLHEVRFEASQLPTGVYLVRMEAAGIVQAQRITLMK